MSRDLILILVGVILGYDVGILLWIWRSEQTKNFTRSHHSQYRDTLQHAAKDRG